MRDKAKHIFLILLLIFVKEIVGRDNSSLATYVLNKDIATNVSTQNYLSSNIVTSIEQDKNGMMWFGTKRGLNSYDSYSFFNPFNMIIDTVIRDYAELYKFELIDIYDLDKIISNLNINVKEASLLMARILYPTRIFDLLEDNYLKEDHKINKTIEYVNSLDKELQRIKNVHSLLKRKYNIRPIEWLRK